MSVWALPLRKARKVNETSNGYVSKITTATEPQGDAGTATGASIIDLVHGGNIAHGSVRIFPYGSGANNTTFSMRVLGWEYTGIGGGDVGVTRETALWIPGVLCEVQCTLSTSVGVANKCMVATERFADTITPTTGNDNITVFRTSTADNTIASLIVLTQGCLKLELQFTTGGSATDCNAWVKLM